MTDDRLLSALRALLGGLLPRLPFLGLYRYRVVQQNIDDRLQLQAVRAFPGLPDMLPISIAAGIPGAAPLLTLGSVVLVSFIEGDPAQPVVTHFSRENSGYVPRELALDAVDLVAIGEDATAVELGAGAAVVVREGDAVSISPGNGSGVVTGTITITSSKSKVKA